QCVRRRAGEPDCGARIHDRKHHIALGDETRHRTDVRQLRLAGERTRAFAAVAQRRANIEALRFQTNGNHLAHIAWAHQADALDLHLPWSPRLASSCGPQTGRMTLLTVTAKFACRPAQRSPGVASQSFWMLPAVAMPALTKTSLGAGRPNE